MTVEFANIIPDDVEESDFETQWKTIPLQEYEVLMQLIPQVQKLQSTIKVMADKIKFRDSLLKSIKKSSANYMNISKLSTVSLFQ